MKRFLKGFGIFLLLMGIGLASAFGVIALLLHQEEVRVPDVIGQDIVTTIEMLHQAGLQLKVERKEPSAVLPKDTVISQKPGPGSSFKKGRPVRVVVSLGPSELQVPKLVGEHYRKAEVMVRQAGFFPGTLARVSSAAVDRDIVIAQSPEPGTPLQRSGRVSLLVSTGKPAVTYVMPKLTGRHADSALRTIEKMGLQYRATYRSSDKPDGSAVRVILGQKPLPGYPVDATETVELVVSK